MPNKVLSGDYSGSTIIGKDILCIATKNGNVTLYKSDIKNYTIINQETKKGTGSSLIGGALFGAVGAIVGATAGSGTTYTIAIEYRVRNAKFRYEQKKSLIELDDRLYKIFMASMF